MTLATLALALAALFSAFVCWFAVQLLKQNGRILTRLDALERAVAQLAVYAEDGAATSAASVDRQATLVKSRLKRDGLEPGTPAPDFRIARIGGGELSPADFRGRPFVLVFSDPDCGPCDVLAPQLERQARSHDVPVMMVSRGDPAANQKKIRQHRLSFPVGLQNHWEISRLYAMFATPIAYRIDEHGVIASPVAKGPDAILRLLSDASAARRHSPALAAAEATS